MSMIFSLFLKMYLKKQIERRSIDLMIYEKIKKICDERGMSVRSLEAKAGLGNGTIKSWENSVPGIARLSAVADILGLPIEYFIEK